VPGPTGLAIDRKHHRLFSVCDRLPPLAFHRRAEMRGGQEEMVRLRIEGDRPRAGIPRAVSG